MLAPRPEAVAVWRALNYQVTLKLSQDTTQSVLDGWGKGEHVAEWGL
jgi:hypothetical protein